MKIPEAVRKAVWKCYNGKLFEVPCFVGCGYIIDAHNYECGHIIANSKGGETTIENLRTICSSCNKSMGTTNMEVFIKTHGFKHHAELIKITQSGADGNPEQKSESTTQDENALLSNATAKGTGLTSFEKSCSDYACSSEIVETKSNVPCDNPIINTSIKLVQTEKTILTEKRQYVCELCEKVFHQRSSLYRHKHKKTSCVSQTVLVETQKELTFDKTKIDFFATKVKTLEQEKEEQQKEILRLNKIIENIGILKDKLKL